MLMAVCASKSHIAGRTQNVITSNHKMKGFGT